jgi:uncharacterized Zn finger protein (UPF0148 family)
MKCCEICGNEIGTRDGDNTCQACEDASGIASKSAKAKRARAAANRRARESALRSCGMVKVRGAMGGTYWE